MRVWRILFSSFRFMRFITLYTRSISVVWFFRKVSKQFIKVKKTFTRLSLLCGTKNRHHHTYWWHYFILLQEAQQRERQVEKTINNV